MIYRKDKYGNDISLLGFGCMRFTQTNGKIDISKAETEIMEAYNSGVNYFDTAYIYPEAKLPSVKFLQKTIYVRILKLPLNYLIIL